MVHKLSWTFHSPSVDIPNNSSQINAESLRGLLGIYAK